VEILDESMSSFPPLLLQELLSSISVLVVLKLGRGVAASWQSKHLCLLVKDILFGILEVVL
jgi:hypothetical protein